MSISGNSLLTGIGSNAGIASGNKSAPQLMASANGHLDRMMRTNPNDSIADSNIARGSIPRAELAAMYQEQATDPIGAIINSNWHSAGASNA